MSQRLTKDVLARRRALGPAAFAALASMLGAGCMRADPNDQAIQAARAALARVSVAGAAAYPAASARAKDYREALDRLKGVNDSADAGQVSAAQILTALAQLGLGEIASQKSAGLESKFLGDVSVARAVLDQWNGQNAVADALSADDPGPALARLDVDIAARTTEANQATAARNALQAQAEERQARAQAAQAQSKALRDADAAGRAGLANLSQTDRAAAMEASAAKRRQADALDKSASLLLAEVDTLTPQMEEDKALTDRLQRQAELLRQAKVDIQKQHDAVLSQAASARSEAMEVGKKLDGLMTALGEARQAADVPCKEAASAYTAGAAAAKRAKSGATAEGAKASSQTAGECEQSRADVLANRARGLGAYSDLLNAVAGAKPPLANSVAYKAKAATAAQEARSATEEAEGAYKAAKALFQSAGVGNKDTDVRGKALIKALQKLGNEKEEPPKDAGAGDAGAPAAGDKPATPGTPASPTPARPADDAKPGPGKPPAPKKPPGD